MQLGGTEKALGKDLGRAFAGALLFALPVLMTMEMWRVGVVIPRSRLALLMAVTMALVVGLAHHFGFLAGGRVGGVGAALEGATALLVGLAAAAVVLVLVSVAQPLQSWREALSVVAVEALPAAVGASFARSMLGEGSQRGGQRQAYHQELLIMTAGAVVFVSSIAPTEEVVLLSVRMSTLDALGLAAFTLVVMHGFVYTFEFKGSPPARGGFGRAFLAFTVVGYVLALAVSAYLLWTFGRYSGTGLQASAVEMVVLALPAGIGAGAARLIV